MNSRLRIERGEDLALERGQFFESSQDNGPIEILIRQ
jgi:hypothetical protein